MAAPKEISGSSSAAASLSGATQQGGNFNFGTAYGPGGLILTDQRGSVGAAALGGSMTMILLFAAVAAVIFFLPRKQ